MVRATDRSFFKLILYLLLMLPSIIYSTQESSLIPNQLSPTMEMLESKDVNNTIIKVHPKKKFTQNDKKEFLVHFESNHQFLPQIEIHTIPGNNSNCHMLRMNVTTTLLGVKEKYCEVTVDKLDKNSREILRYLEIFCRQNQHPEFQQHTGKFQENMSKCQLNMESGDKYIVTIKNSQIGDDLMSRICEGLSLLNYSEIKYNSLTPYCISVSEYYMEYNNQRCCVGSFNFLPREALQLELITIWVETDGYAYTIGFFYILSFICLCIIFVSGLVSRKYRSERGNQILMHFAFAIFSQFVLHNLACRISITDLWCDLHSIAFHYFTLVESCWTAIIAYLQFRRFVKVFDNEPNHLIVKLCAIAYIFPILPISLRIIYHQKMSIQIVNYLTVGLPEFSILLINTTLLILITRNIVFVKNEYIEHKKSLTMEVKLIFFLFFVLDFSWFDIILAHFTANMFFIYLYLFTQSLQGFMLFFVFGIMNDHNRLIYRKFLTVYLKKMLRLR